MVLKSCWAGRRIVSNRIECHRCRMETAAAVGAHSTRTQSKLKMQAGGERGDYIPSASNLLYGLRHKNLTI